MKGQKGASISFSFVFISESGKQDDKLKKILFPSNYTSLLKSVNLLYKDKYIVRSIYTSDGCLVRSMDDVTPGSILIVSPNEALPMENDTDTKVVSLNSQDQSSNDKNDNRFTTKRNNKNNINNSNGNSNKMNNERKTAYNQLFGLTSKKPAQTQVKQTNQSQNTTIDVNDGASSDRNRNNEDVSANDSNSNASKTNKQRGKSIPASTNPSDLVSSDNHGQRRSRKSLNQKKNKSNNQTQKQQQVIEQVPADLFSTIDDKNTENSDNSDYSKINQKSNKENQSPQSTTSANSKNNSKKRGSSPKNDKYFEMSGNQSEEETKHEEYDDSSLRQIATELLNEESFATHIKEALEFFDEGSVHFLQVGQPFEDAQRNWWFIRCLKYLESQDIGQHGNYMFAYDQIKQYVKDVVSKHRFILTNEVSEIRMKMAICGPRQSGKSTLLSMISEQVLLETAVNGNWKNSVFFFLNMSECCSFYSDFKLLYMYIVDFSLRAVTLQRPDLQPHYSMLLKYFNSILEFKKTPLLRKIFSQNPQFQKFAQNCENLASFYIKMWNDEDTRMPFYMFIFQFPYLIASAAGFTNFFVLLDNIDYADIVVEDEIDSSKGISVIDAVQILLQKVNYIISCESQQDMFNILDEKTELIGTFNLQADTNYANSQFLVKFKGNEQMTLSSAHCGEIPAFVSIWEDINAIADEINEGANEGENVDEEKSEQNEEIEATLISLVQKFVNDMITDQNGGKLKVVSVRRSNK